MYKEIKVYTEILIKTSIFFQKTKPEETVGTIDMGGGKINNILKKWRSYKVCEIQKMTDDRKSITSYSIMKKWLIFELKHQKKV